VNILFVGYAIGRQGKVETYNAHFVCTLLDLRHSVTIFTYDGCNLSVSTDNHKKIDLSWFNIFPGAHLIKKILLIWFLFFFIDRFDLVICGHFHFLTTIMRFYQRIKHIWLCSYGIEIWPKWSDKEMKAINRCDKIITISHFTKISIEKRLQNRKTFILPTPVDTDFFKPSSCGHKRSSNRKILLTVGRLSARERYKGHDTVLECLPVIKEKVGKPIEYWIAGGGDDMQRLAEKVERLGLEKNVIFWGRVSERKLLELYQFCDLFIMPSKLKERNDGSWAGEGFGIVFIEASACGKPVIAPQVGGSVDAVIDGVTGFSVDPFDHGQIVNAVLAILKDEYLAEEMGKRGREFVLENYSLEIFREKVKYLIENMAV